MTTATPVLCRQCERRRVRAWEETRARNGLTAAEWPRPVAPEFPDLAALYAHTERHHRRSN